MKDTHILVINLEKNKERMAFMDRQLKALGLAYERIPAVYGATLTKDERKKCFARFHSFLAMGYPLAPGEIGCSLSHLICYKRILSEGWDGALIFEDDAVIEPGFPQAFERIREKRVAGHPQVFQFTACLVPNKKTEMEIERITGAVGTYGYWISREATAIIVKANDPVVTVADRWGRWVKRYGLELSRVWPTMVKHDNATFGSEIDFSDHSGLHGLRKFVFKISRVPEVLLDWLWFKLTGR